MEAFIDVGYEPWVIQMPPSPVVTDEWFSTIALRNRDWRVERNSKGDIEFMSPTGGESGAKNSRINARLFVWAELEGMGTTFDSSTGFRLPNTAIRSPDASWVTNSRLAELTTEQLSGYLPLAPDFVIELRSKTDSLPALKAKLQEYIDNGTELGWLIDPLNQQLHIYRLGHSVEVVEAPATVSGDPVLKGFVLNLTEIW